MRRIALLLVLLVDAACNRKVTVSIEKEGGGAQATAPSQSARDERRAPVTREPGATVGPAASAPSVAAPGDEASKGDAEAARAALEAWASSELGATKDSMSVVLASVEPQRVLFKFSAGSPPPAVATVALVPGLTGWVVDKVLDEQAGAWIYPDAFAHDFQRRRAKETDGAMRTLATAAESYSIDNNQYPVTSDPATLRAVLEPTYVKRVPLRDGWGRELTYVAEPAQYCIVSLGSDGKPSRSAKDVAGLMKGTGATKDPARDIVFCVGSFVDWLE